MLNPAHHHEMTAMVLMLVITFIALVPALIFSTMYRKKMSAALELLKPALNGTVKASFFATRFIGEFQGYSFTITPVPAGKNTPPFLNVNLTAKFSFTIQAVIRSPLNELGRKLSFKKEISTGDYEFDRRLIVTATNPLLASGCLQSSDVRRAVLALFNAGFTSFRIQERGIFVQKPNFTLEADVTPARLQEILQNLALLARN
ncbi:MAG: hypothetical protein V2A78_04635 [bacterium]